MNHGGHGDHRGAPPCSQWPYSCSAVVLMLSPSTRGGRRLVWCVIPRHVDGNTHHPATNDCALRVADESTEPFELGGALRFQTNPQMPTCQAKRLAKVSSIRLSLNRSPRVPETPNEG